MAEGRGAKVAEAQRLRESGLKYREIADEMGLALSTIKNYVNDPTGAKLRARKDSYRGTCECCGASTDGSNGKAKAPKRCSACASRKARVWTHEKLIAAMRAWAERYGKRPVATDWSPAIAEYHCLRNAADWPSTTIVVKRFGSWSAAITAAFPEPQTSPKKTEARAA